jgi:hypothetical protein
VREELAWVVEIESVWDPTATNMLTDATGLIQFMPATAKGMGTTTDALRGMSREQQAPYVQKFYDQTTSNGKRKLARVGDLYILTFMPGHLGSPDETVIFAPGTKGWEQNKGLRESPEGPITAGSVRRRGTPPEPMPTVGASSSKPGPSPKPTPGPGSAGPGLLLLLLALYFSREGS